MKDASVTRFLTATTPNKDLNVRNRKAPRKKKEKKLNLLHLDLHEIFYLLNLLSMESDILQMV